MRRERLLELARVVLGDRKLVVVDVGAAGGLLPEVAAIAEHVDALGFEPNAEECARLNATARTGQRFLPVAVAGTDGKRTLHVTRKPSSSSLLVPDAEYHARFPDAERMDVVQTLDVPTRSLGSILDELGIRPELLKLDVHGVEPEILRSLQPHHWDSLLAVHTELLTGSHFHDQASFSDVDPLLREHGFELFHLKRYSVRRAAFDAWHYTSRGQLEFVEALYLRGPDDVDPQRLALVASLFDHHDLALVALEQSGAKDAAVLVRALSARPGRLARLLATWLIGVGELGRRWYGATGGWWSSDGPTDPV